MTEDARPDPVETFRMPILEHIRELRRRVIVAGWAFAIALGGSFLFARQLFEWLAKPMNDALTQTHTGSLAVVQATEGFMVQMKTAALAALFISSPIWFFQVWRFVGPGLYDKEKRVILPLVGASTGLFLGGASFAYFVVFRVGFPIFLQMNGPDVTAVLSIDSYLGFATTLLVAFGVSFQLPVVIYFLARMGIVNHLDLIHGFRYGVLVIAVVAAVLTPPDVLSMSLMAVPLLLLYGIGIIVARIFSTKPIPAAA